MSLGWIVLKEPLEGTVWYINDRLSGNLPKLATEVSGRFPVKSLVIPALFELYTVKSTRGLELIVSLTT